MEFFIEIIKVIILGIVEGITEWLPISSTGHMLLVDEFLQLSVSPQFKEMFMVVIQLGAILAVVLLYFNKLNPFSPRKSVVEKRETWNIWFKVIIGCIPAAVLGVLFDDWFDKHFYNPETIAIALIVYGIVFIAVENRQKGQKLSVSSFEDLSLKTALLIGVFQVLSLVPGTSRSGATIIGALLLGTSRYIATEFSFFMSIPIMFGASLLKLVGFGFAFNVQEAVLLIVGMMVAFVVSLIAIRFLLKYIKKNDFKVFGWYRIVLGIIVLFYFWVIA